MYHRPPAARSPHTPISSLSSLTSSSSDPFKRFLSLRSSLHFQLSRPEQETRRRGTTKRRRRSSGGCTICATTVPCYIIYIRTIIINIYPHCAVNYIYHLIRAPFRRRHRRRPECNAYT